MLFRLSKVVPVPMRSVYGSTYHDEGALILTRATWWQWRGRVWRHRVTVLA